MLGFGVSLRSRRFPTSMKTVVVLFSLTSHFVHGSPHSKRDDGCIFVDNRNGERYPGNCMHKAECGGANLSQAHVGQCGSDSSLVCCTSVGFNCQDTDAIFREFYCQNVESGCDGGRFYQRQEEDPHMCPGAPSEIRCCVPDATSPLSPKPEEDDGPSEPALSLVGSSDLSMLPDTGLSSKDEWGLMQMNFEPAGNLPANVFPEDALGISFASSPSFGQTFDSGLFDVASLPATSENEFTAFLDDHLFSQDSFSTQDSLFAMGPDSEENLWIS